MEKLQPHHTSDCPDCELIEQLRAGNTSSFTIIVERHQQYIHAVILRITADPDLTQDFTQDTFMKAFEWLKNPDKIHDSKGDLRAWLVLMATRICMDHFRKTKRMPLMFLAGELTTDDTLFTEYYQKSPEELQIEYESQQFRRECMRTCIKKLPSDEQRDVIMLSAYSNMCSKQIAEIMNVLDVTTRARKRYALKHIAQYAKQFHVTN